MRPPKPSSSATRAPKSPPQLGLGLLPAGLEGDAAFVAAWDDWLADRAERRLPRYTARAWAMQLKRLEALGPVAAVAAIEWSIAQGYKGIFEPPAAREAAGKPAASAPAKPPSAWEVNKKLELVEQRIKELRNRSPGEHCHLADFLSEAELAELRDLMPRRTALRAELLRC